MLMPYSATLFARFTARDPASANSQLRRYSPFLCTEQCCTCRCYWLLGGLHWLQGQNVVCFVVHLVGRHVTWCAGRAADSDTVVTVRTGLNFGADLCQDHLFLTSPAQTRCCLTVRRVSQRCSCVTSHGLIGPEVVFEVWSDIWLGETGVYVASECRDHCTQWHLMIKCRLCFELCLSVSISLSAVTSYVWLRHKYCVGPCKWSKLIWLWTAFLVD